MTFQVPNKYRVRTGRMGTQDDAGNNGLFFVKLGQLVVRVIASDGGLGEDAAWEHVSASLPNRCPTWPEMCRIKDLFWSKESVVVQYHPAESEYVNIAETCLHLWRPIGIAFPTPPAIMVGPPG